MSRIIYDEPSRTKVRGVMAISNFSFWRVNPDAPLQNRVLCRMRGCWPDGFQPCSGDDFLPIPADVPARCHP
ncbi:MAG TPA: hypothetical protein VG056_10570 [Pirellulales bacterium]|nr:hypothetical protein [Pirellulales bacterium]